MRINVLRFAGIGAFLAAVTLAACSGGGTSTPSSATTPTAAPTGPTPTPTPRGPSPTPTPTGSPVPTPTPVATGANALIDFTGSYSYGPFTIDQYSNGIAIVTQSTGQGSFIVEPHSLVTTFFHQLSLNLPVNDIKIGTCPKPTTAPTDQTLITYQNLTSPDVSCPGSNAKTKALYESILALENAVGIRSMLGVRNP